MNRIPLRVFLLLAIAAGCAGIDRAELSLRSGGEFRLDERFSPATNWSKAEGVAVDFANDTEYRLLVGLAAQGLGNERLWAPLSVNPHTKVTLFFDWGPAGSWEGARAIGSMALTVTGLENPEGPVSRGPFRRLDSARWVGSPPTALAKPPSNAELYRPFTVSAGVSFPGGNPYDERVFSVEGVWTAPSGRVLVVPGYWEVPYREVEVEGYSSRRASGPGAFRLRFAPDEPGPWSWVVRHREGTGPWVLDRQGSLLAVDTGASAPVRFSPRDPHYFEDARGAGWFALGANVAWYDSRGWKAYDRWFTDLKNGGGNYARIWLASWGFGYEWDQGAGDYTARQDRAWDLDRVMEAAEAHGIKVMLCLFNHGAFSSSTNPEWKQNPWNRVNGGPLVQPEDLVSNPEADRLVAQRLRYAVARWGASPSLLAWELFNEANLAGVTNRPEWPQWVSRTAGYLRAVDPGLHMVTSSVAGAPQAGEPEWTSLDFLQEHKYGLNDWSAYFGRQVSASRSFSTKPYLFGEYGVAGNLPDPAGLVLHEGIWGGFFSGSAGTAMLWWWDEYLETWGLWREYLPLAKFLAGEDLPALGLVPAKMVAKDGRQTYRLLGRNKIFLWQKDKELSWGGYQDRLIESRGAPVTWRDWAPSLLEVPVDGDQNWHAEFWSPTTGANLGSVDLVPQEGRVQLPLPAYHGDVAVKLVRLPLTSSGLR